MTWAAIAAAPERNFRPEVPGRTFSENDTRRNQGFAHTSRNPKWPEMGRGPLIAMHVLRKPVMFPCIS